MAAWSNELVHHAPHWHLAIRANWCAQVRAVARQWWAASGSRKTTNTSITSLTLQPAHHNIGPHPTVILWPGTLDNSGAQGEHRLQAARRCGAAAPHLVRTLGTKMGALGVEAQWDGPGTGGLDTRKQHGIKAPTAPTIGQSRSLTRKRRPPRTQNRRPNRPASKQHHGISNIRAS